jgi:hypothetical protein
MQIAEHPTESMCLWEPDIPFKDGGRAGSGGDENDSGARAGKAARASRTPPESVRWSGESETSAIT